MYELMLDTADLDALRKGAEAWPVAGITCNPSILKKLGKVELKRHIAEMKRICGAGSLHVQAVAADTQGIIDDAHAILDAFGKDVYVKVPVDAQGLPAIKRLHQEGVHITATAVYTTMQGMLAALAGADYIAVYYNRCLNNCIDPDAVIAELREFIDGSGSASKILGASFKNVGQVTRAWSAGAHSVTVSPDIIETALGLPFISKAVADFKGDFESIYGAGTDMVKALK